MNRLKLLLPMAFIIMLLAGGCAPKQMSREEFLSYDQATRAAMTRTYKNVNPEQLIAAAEKALLHSDRDYRIISHDQSGFFAQRRWSVYAVLAAVEGYDSWRVITEGGAGESKITIVSWYAGGESITPMLNMSASGGGINSVSGHSSSTQSQNSDQFYLSPPLYNLFFERL